MTPGYILSPQNKSLKKQKTKQKISPSIALAVFEAPNSSQGVYGPCPPPLQHMGTGFVECEILPVVTFSHLPRTTLGFGL